MHILEDEPTKELNKQLKEIKEELDSDYPQFKSNLWLRKLRIIKELSYRKKKWVCQKKIVLIALNSLSMCIRI